MTVLTNAQKSSNLGSIWNIRSALIYSNVVSHVAMLVFPDH